MNILALQSQIGCVFYLDCGTRAPVSAGAPMAIEGLQRSSPRNSAAKVLNKKWGVVRFYDVRRQFVVLQKYHSSVLLVFCSDYNVTVLSYLVCYNWGYMV